jgi:hypothetical protein
MFHIEEPMVALTYGQIHVIELGIAIGLLAATFYRTDRYLSYAILALSASILPLAHLLQMVPDVTETTFRIATKPQWFLIPMLTVFGLRIALPQIVRLRRDQSEPPKKEDPRTAD